MEATIETAKAPEPELIVGPVYGFRSWHVGRYLRSFHRNSIWRPGQAMRARCVLNVALAEPLNARYIVSRHIPPAERCVCGLFAFRNPENLPMSQTRVFAVGLVALWGKVVEHESGFRGEWAYPARLWLVGRRVSEARAARLSALYGVAVERFETKGLLPNVWQRRLKNLLWEVSRGFVPDGPHAARAACRAAGVAARFAPAAAD